MGLVTRYCLTCSRVKVDSDVVPLVRKGQRCLSQSHNLNSLQRETDKGKWVKMARPYDPQSNNQQGG
jgi:hypothetical protein